MLTACRTCKPLHAHRQGHAGVSKTSFVSHNDGMQGRGLRKDLMHNTRSRGHSVTSMRTLILKPGSSIRDCWRRCWR